MKAITQDQLRTEARVAELGNVERLAAGHQGLAGREGGRAVRSRVPVDVARPVQDPLLGIIAHEQVLLAVAFHVAEPGSGVGVIDPVESNGRRQIARKSGLPQAA